MKQGHRAYLDLGSRTAPSSVSSGSVSRKWHRAWSNPPALAAGTRQSRDVEQARAEGCQSGGDSRNAQ